MFRKMILWPPFSRHDHACLATLGLVAVLLTVEEETGSDGDLEMWCLSLKTCTQISRLPVSAPPGILAP